MAQATTGAKLKLVVHRGLVVIAKQDGQVTVGFLNERPEPVKLTDLRPRSTFQMIGFGRIVRFETGGLFVGTLVLVVNQVTHAHNAAAALAQGFARLKVGVTDKCCLQSVPQFSPLTVHISDGDNLDHFCIATRRDIGLIISTRTRLRAVGP